MIDKRALYAISAGVYVFTTTEGGESGGGKSDASADGSTEARPVGRLVDAVSQVASEPKRVSIALMKAGHTSGVVAAAGVGGRFALTVLGEGAPAGVIEAFGYQSSKATDKFAGLTTVRDEASCPYVTEGAVAEMSCVVCDILDMGSHLLVIGDVTEARVLSDEAPMTYAGFRAAKAAAKAKAKAETVTEEIKETAKATEAAVAEAATTEDPAPAKARIGWRCTICGVVIERDELPDNFTCPLCGVGKDLFERITL